MDRESTPQLKQRDARWETLKRRVQLLARLDGARVMFTTGLHVVTAERVKDAGKLAGILRDEGALDLANFEAHVVSKRAPLHVTAALLATAHRDLRALAVPAARALVREHKRALARYGTIDAAWIEDKTARVDALSEALARTHERPWFESAVEIARAVHGDASAARLEAAHARLASLGADRRRAALARLDALLAALAVQGAHRDPELATLAARLERARDLPGRARHTRVLAVLSEALGCEARAPARALREPLQRPFADLVREAGRAMVAALPTARDTLLIAKTLDVLATFGMAFRVGEDGVPLASQADVAHAAASAHIVKELEKTDATFAQALVVAGLDLHSSYRARIARFIAEGLEIDLVRAACAAGQGNDMARAQSVRAARAYATWATRLVPHYASLGITFVLSPELFANLPKNEDLGVLAMCLMDQAHRGESGGDPLAVLDATLGLFQTLPGKVSGILGRLRGTSAGAGRRSVPEFAEWLGEDELLDKYMHLARAAGKTTTLTTQIREDFDYATKTARERAHLEGLAARSTRQEARLAVIRSGDRTLDGAPRGRTKRRLQARIDALMPIAYRRELDASFREVLRDAWGIAVPSLTPAWRDAVRFWLVVDDNRTLLGQLLREAAKTPGRDVKSTFAPNRVWIEAERKKWNVDAWLRPRSAEVFTFTVSLEEDPLEVLRMGIPFATCLALDDGCNASSTIVNAIDANKRVIYVRSREGSVVARKLLTVTKEGCLLGYHLYIATRGPDERPIRVAVDTMCRAIAEEAGLMLANSGAPERLNGSFWYDDGAIPFEDDTDVSAYCSLLGLAPPAKSYASLGAEARGLAAVDAGDLEAALAAFDEAPHGPAADAVGRFIVARLGRGIVRHAEARGSLVRPALMAMVTHSTEDEMVRALAASTRFIEWTARNVLVTLLARFGRSARIARAIADLAVRAMRVNPQAPNHGLVRWSMLVLAPRLDGIEASFDSLDRVERPWNRMASLAPVNVVARDEAEESVIAAVQTIDTRDPDDDAIKRCLTSRHRSALAQRAALRIAARRVVPDGLRLLQRVLRIRPELATLPDMLAATLRQGGPIASQPSRPPFEALRDLLFSDRSADLDLTKWATRDSNGAWAPGPWELAWYREHPAGRPAIVIDKIRDIKTSDARQIEGAIANLRAGKDPDEARTVLLNAAMDWPRVAVALAAHDIETARTILETKLYAQLLDAESIVALWQHEGLRGALCDALARRAGDDWSARAFACERLADEKELSIAGLFEAWVLALGAKSAAETACDTDTLDQLRQVIRVVVERAEPAHAIAFYAELFDELSASLFIRALKNPRLPRERAAALRQAARKFKFVGDRGAARSAWLMATRLQKGASSSTEDR